jgi:hypothetical protein
MRLNSTLAEGPLPAVRASDIVNLYGHWCRSPLVAGTIRAHSRRYAFLLRTINRMIPLIRQTRGIEPLRILVVGPYLEVEILRDLLPDATVNSLGFPDQSLRPRGRDRHIEFDLNEAFFRQKWPVLEPHHLVVMANVIEHLYTSPDAILQCAASWLAPSGCIVLQTPNAVSLARRVSILCGRQAYDRIGPNRLDPGRFREYTLAELIAFAAPLGLRVVFHARGNDFAPPREGLKKRVVRFARHFFPASFADGITICYQKA